MTCNDNRISSLKRRATIQNVTTVSDGQGGSTETWIDGDDIWCSIEPMKGYERFQAMQMQTPVTHKIVARYRTDITTASRIKFQDRIFWVKEALNEFEDKQYLLIKALERA